MLRGDFEELRFLRRYELKRDATAVHSDPLDRAEGDSLWPCASCPYERLDTETMRLGGRLAVAKEEDLVPANRHLLERREL